MGDKKRQMLDDNLDRIVNKFPEVDTGDEPVLEVYASSDRSVLRLVLLGANGEVFYDKTDSETEVLDSLTFIVKAWQLANIFGPEVLRKNEE